MNFEEILKEELGEDIVLDDSIDDAAVDSLEYICFLKRLEDKFNVLIPDEQLGNFDTFRQLEEYVEELAAHA